MISEAYHLAGENVREHVVTHAADPGAGLLRVHVQGSELLLDLGEFGWREVREPGQDVLATVEGVPIVVAAGGRVHVGFDWWGWEQSVLSEASLPTLQPTYSKLPIPYTKIPFEPRVLLNRWRIRGLRARENGRLFPLDPVDTSMDRLRDLIVSHARELAGEAPHPAPAREVVLTHDLDEQYGVPGIELLRSVERTVGACSSFGILSERYRLDEALLLGLIDEGCEIFSHGYLHDGTIAFLEPVEIRRRLSHFFTTYPAIADSVRGFRAGQLVRSPRLFDAVAELFDYDLTVPNVELGGPHGWRTGCASTIPFARDNGLLHIPLTLPQDYGLSFIERRSPEAIASIWLEATEQVWAVGGTPVHLIHPDNVLRRPGLLDAYGTFLGALSERGCSFTLPGAIAARWPRASRTAA